MKKLMILTAALIAVAAPAHADPVTAVATWIATTFNVGVATAFAIANTAIGIGVSAIASAFQRPPEFEGASVQLDVQMADDLPLSFTVGDYATAGRRKYIKSWGKNNRFVTEVIEFSALPQDLAGMWIDDEQWSVVAGRRGSVPTAFGPDNLESVTGYNTGSLPSGHVDLGAELDNYRDDGDSTNARMWVKWFDGTQTAADPLTIFAATGDTDYPWTSAMIGTGKAYAVVTVRKDSDSLTSYPGYLFEPEPLSFYDIRQDSTNGGSGPHRWNNPATWEPSRNPAVIAYNIIRGIHFDGEWIYGGKDLDAWRLPSAEWIAAANACDETVNLAGGGTERRYRCGMEISVDVKPVDVLEELGRAANMRFAEVGGQIKPVVDIPATSVFSFTDENIITTEGQSFQPFYPVSETYNAISATYPERGERWASKDAREYVNAQAMEDDGGRYLPTSMAYGAVPFAKQVQRLQRSQIRDFRRMRRHQFYLRPEAYGLEPGDTVSWTSARNGYLAKRFMVETVVKTPGMNVLVSLREIDPSDYDWSSDFETPVVITPPRNPVRWTQPINGLTVTSALIEDTDGVGRRPAILVACDGDEVGVTNIQIQGRVTGRSTTIDTNRRFSEPHSWYLTNVLPLTTYEVRARLLSDLTPKSQWSPWLTVTTPDVKLGPLDLEMEAIQAEVTADLSSLEDWAESTGDYIRDIRDQLDAARDLAAELGAQAELDREEIRRKISADMGDFRADYEERIDVLVTADTAIASAITALNVQLDGKASASAVQALITRVSTVEGEIVAQSDAITQTNARVDRSSANGLLRITSTAAPSGAQTRIGLRAEASDSDTSHSAALYLDARSDGTSQMIVAADRFSVATGLGSSAGVQVPFIVDGGQIYMTNAFIRNADIVRAKIADAAVDTLKVAGRAITAPRRARRSSSYTTPNGSWNTVLSLTFAPETTDSDFLIIGLIKGLQTFGVTTGGTTYSPIPQARITWRGSSLGTYDPNETRTVIDMISAVGTGSGTLTFDVRNNGDTSAPNGSSVNFALTGGVDLICWEMKR